MPNPHPNAMPRNLATGSGPVYRHMTKKHERSKERCRADKSQPHLARALVHLAWRDFHILPKDAGVWTKLLYTTRTYLVTHLDLQQVYRLR